jgi:DNA-directed RNA polymerase subunit F
MIKSTKPLSMAEATEYAKLGKEGGKETLAFIKKFNKMKPKEAKEMRKKLEELNMIKIDAGNISKIIDVMPEIPEELTKILVGVNLDDEETKKILEVVKEFK